MDGAKILSAGKKDTDEILEEPENYVDSQQYVSWERFYTALLIEKSQKEKYMR